MRACCLKLTQPRGATAPLGLKTSRSRQQPWPMTRTSTEAQTKMASPRSWWPHQPTAQWWSTLTALLPARHKPPTLTQTAWPESQATAEVRQAQDSDVSTASLTITPVNDARVAGEQSVSTPGDTLVAINLIAVDVYFSWAGLQFVISTQLQHGVLTLKASGNLRQQRVSPASCQVCRLKKYRSAPMRRLDG